MEKHDRDELDRHIEQSDDTYDADTFDDSTLSEQDRIDLASVNGVDEDTHPLREVSSEITAYLHPVIDSQLRETWLQGTASDGRGGQYIFRLDSGAGLGHGELSLLIEHETPADPEIDGDNPHTERLRWEYIDMTTLVETWVEDVIRRIEQKRNHDALSDAQSDESER